MKITVSEVRKAQKQLLKLKISLVKSTMKEKKMGLKDAYDDIQKEYLKRYKGANLSFIFS